MKGGKGGGRNPYAAAHSMRGGAGAGAHRDGRRRQREALEDALVDPYGPEWMDVCGSGRIVDTDVHICSGSSRPEPLSRQALLLRGRCCGSGCTNCPYEPRHVGGSTGTVEQD